MKMETPIRTKREVEPLWQRALERRKRIAIRRRQRTSSGPEHGAKVKAGHERARARGVRIGRLPNPRLTPEALEQAQVMLRAGLCLGDTAAKLHVGRTTLHRVLPKGAASMTHEQLSERSRRALTKYWAGMTQEQKDQRTRWMREKAASRKAERDVA